MTARSRLPRLGALATALALLVAPGCLKLKSTLTLAKDGSGTLNEKATFELSKVDELKEAAKMLMPGAEAWLDAALDGTDMKAIQKRLENKPCIGLQLLSQTQDYEAKTLTGQVKLKFTSLGECLGTGPGFPSSRLVELSLDPGADGTWTLTRKMLMPGGFDIPEIPSEEDKARIELGKGMIGHLFTEFEVVIQLDVPGQVVSTNGTKNEAGTGVTWTMAFADIETKLKQTVTFKGEGLTLKPFRVRLDQQGNVLPGATGTTPPPAAPKDPPKEPAAPSTPK
jgi:hypothetical protein